MPPKITVEVVIKTDKPVKTKASAEKPTRKLTDEHKANIKAGLAKAKAKREAEKKTPRILTDPLTGASKPMPPQIARLMGIRV